MPSAKMIVTIAVIALAVSAIVSRIAAARQIVFNTAA